MISDWAKPILDGAYKLQHQDGHDASYVFQQPVDRKLTEYYRIIKRPMALSTIAKNLKAGKYSSIAQFITDFAQITHNARVFNHPDSFIYQDAVVLDDYLKQQLERLRQQSPFPQPELVYPDLGPLPTHQPLPQAPAANYDSMDSDSMSDSDDDSRRRRRQRRSVMLGRRKRQEADDDEEERSAAENAKRRGRPPTVDKPHEHRIKAILRAIRRERDQTGRSLYVEFDKLPDARYVPDYYDVIKEPIALDAVRKNIKRRKYPSVELFLRDMHQMFNNAKQYNAETSQIYVDAAHLQSLLVAVADEELKKPDSAYQDPDSNSKTSRLPLDSVEHRGDTYSVGDWVHISNANDPAKPIIGQIFRMWQEGGQKWVNVCWYYRPEQTVHRVDKLFYENEVMKSGQYRDHSVDEILEKCFVMYITKYQRGRPVGIGQRSVYCCESRYNETEKSFNKIRTWKACIPDEIRSTDYPMDMFDRPRPLRRVASPIRNLLPADAKDTDPKPEPRMGAPNAPPIVGGVYKRPIDPNEPPETPSSPAPASAGPTPAAAGARSASPMPPPPPSLRNGPSAPSHANTPTPGPQHAHTAASSAYSTPPAMPQPPAALSHQPPSHHAASHHAPSHQATSHYAAPVGVHPGNISGPAMPSSYALPEQYVSGLPPQELANVAKLKDGQMLWFPSCPVWVSHRVQNDPLPPDVEFGPPKEGLVSAKGFGFSAKYLAWKARAQ